MDKFYLHKLCVDTTRGKVISVDTESSVEPKAMAVLVYLAERPHTVVSQEELFAVVWPNSVFSSGALQRCIAQLRKALNDDAKFPTFIKTHPKRGYSLDVEPKISGPYEFTDTTSKWAVYFFICLAIVFFAAVVFTRLLSDESNGVTKLHGITGKLTALTSTSNYDFYPVFSPDEQQLAFIRQTDTQVQIVMKSLVASTETVLVGDTFDYQALAWSKDNLTLFYVKRESEGDVIGKVDVSTGKTTDFYTSTITGQIWRVFPNGSSLFFVVADTPLNRPPESALYELNLLSNESTLLLQSTADFTPYRFALNSDKSVFAIAGEGAQSTIEFRMFSLETLQLHAPFTTLPLGFTEITWFDEDSLLVHHLNKLYILSLRGKFSKLPVEGFLRLFNPATAPISRKIALSVTEHDFDLLMLNINTGESDVVVDSEGEDHLARISPDGRHIAYVSAKSGVQQVILSKDGETVRLFENASNLPVYRSPVWDNNGDNVIFSFGNELSVYDIHTQQLTTEYMPMWFTSVIDSYSHSDALLISTKSNNSSFFEKYEPESKTTVRLQETGVNYFARLDPQNELVFYMGNELHWRGKTFSHSLFGDSNGYFFPIGNDLIFQSNRSIWRFDGVNVTRFVETIPQRAHQLIDVQNDLLLFQTSGSPKARIVLIE